MNWLLENWEKSLFRLVGAGLLIFAAFKLLELSFFENVAGFVALLGASAFFFLYANIHKFKRIKGLGIEMEHWEKTQKEADELIDQMREIVRVYSEEILLNKIMSGRWGSSMSWQENWKLFDKITETHVELGHKLDFSKIKKDFDAYFLYDGFLGIHCHANRVLGTGKTGAKSAIISEFGIPVVDVKGYESKNTLVNALPNLKISIEQARNRELCNHTLDVFDKVKHFLQTEFEIEIDMPEKMMTDIRKFQELEKSENLEITDELINFIQDMIAEYQ